MARCLPTSARRASPVPLGGGLARTSRHLDRAESSEEAAQGRRPPWTEGGGDLDLHVGDDVERVFDLLPAACGEANQPGTSVGRVATSLDVSDRFETLDEVRHRRFGHLGLGGEVGDARPPWVDVLEHHEVGDPQIVVAGVVKAPQQLGDEREERLTKQDGEVGVRAMVALGITAGSRPTRGSACLLDLRKNVLLYSR